MSTTAPTKTITLTGSVSAQKNSGETVVIAITLPNGTKVQVNAPTDSFKNYNFKYFVNLKGTYVAVATISSDGLYKQASSAPQQFTLKDGRNPSVDAILVFFAWLRNLFRL